MPLQVFDRLNDINSPKLRSMPYSKYFGEMQLTRQQKEERIALANDIEDVVLFFFNLVLLESQYDYMGAISSVEAKEAFAERMAETVAKHTELTDGMRQRIEDFVDETSRVTIEHLIILKALIQDDTDKDKEKQKSEEYYISDDRARFMSEEEANTLFNMADFDKAKKQGYRYKTWKTMHDSRVRPTHIRVEDKKIPIDELFMVGNSFMRFPRDWQYGSARECIACRCSLKFTKS